MLAGFLAIPEGIKDLARVLATSVWVERARTRIAPGLLLPAVRARGREARERDLADRERLRRIIGRVDAHFPGGGNCYRRALVEIALEPEAAREPIHFGLRAHGGPGSGHAWLADRRGTNEHYDAELAL
jgi:hypothetical protein